MPELDPGNVTVPEIETLLPEKQTTPPDGLGMLVDEVMELPDTVFPPVQLLVVGPVGFPQGLFRTPEFIVGFTPFGTCCKLELPTTSTNGALIVPAPPVTDIASEVFEFT
jgi:hypothetical protein